MIGAINLLCGQWLVDEAWIDVSLCYKAGNGTRWSQRDCSGMIVGSHLYPKYRVGYFLNKFCFHQPWIKSLFSLKYYSNTQKPSKTTHGTVINSHYHNTLSSLLLNSCRMIRNQPLKLTAASIRSQAICRAITLNTILCLFSYQGLLVQTLAYQRKRHAPSFIPPNCHTQWQPVNVYSGAPA